MIGCKDLDASQVFFKLWNILPIVLSRCHLEPDFVNEQQSFDERLPEVSIFKAEPEVGQFDLEGDQNFIVIAGGGFVSIAVVHLQARQDEIVLMRFSLAFLFHLITQAIVDKLRFQLLAFGFEFANLRDIIF